MRTKTLSLVMALAAITLMFASTSHAVSHTDKAKAATADAKKSATKTADKMKTDAAADPMVADMMKMGAPGPAHEGLKGMVGTWKASQKSWFAPGEPTTSTGVCENKLILGGRFVQQSFKGDFMGMPFEGMGVTGYDNQQKTYNTFWIDNLGTAMMTGSGNMNEDGNELTMTAAMPGPDGKPQPTRMVTKIIDPSKHVFSMYVAQPDGKEQLMMEITYTKM